MKIITDRSFTNLYNLYLWMSNYLDTGDFLSDGDYHLKRLASVLKQMDTTLTSKKLKEKANEFWGA